MLFKNALIFFPEGRFAPGSFTVENGLFAQVTEGELPGEGIDLRGAKVLPGLVDIHLHGAAGADFSDGNCEGLHTMAAFLAKHGVTSFVPASMTLPREALCRAVRSAAAFQRQSGESRLAGLRLEGPYLSAGKKGAQNGAYLRKADMEEFEELLALSGGLLRIADAAPEAEGVLALTERFRRRCVFSAGHTETDYDSACRFFDAGGSHVTHLFNAMPPLHHRAPGLLGAAAERETVTAELISDGYHVHPSAVRLAFRLFPGRLCLVSDALRCCGLEEGDYELGGQTVTLRDGAARLPDGTLAGAAADLFTDLRRAVSFGIPEEEAIRAATALPAAVIGRDGDVGSIAPGRFADFLVCGGSLGLREVYMGGTRV